MRIVFMGTPDFSVPVLERLIEEGHTVEAVVTQGDKPKGRGKEIQFPPVKTAALEHNIAVYQPVKVRDPEFVQVLKDINPDVMVVIAFGQILSQEVLDIPKYGCINIHASLLPKFRGSAPIQWAIIEGESVTGVTTMYMDAGIDTGDMIEKIEVAIDKDETGGSLHDKLAVAGADIIISTLKKLEDGTAVRTPQEHEKSTYVKMLDKKLGKIDFSMDAEYIERLIRGLNPWPSAYTTYNGKSLKIWKAQVEEGSHDAGTYGEIVQVEKDYIGVKTGKGILKVYELQLEGKKRMETEDFLRGYKICMGEVLGL
ncbi:MAG: methionyl-tRNA formyltransferase [Lachnospiraceae bacterium]|nr:methionyl-tRNA formyltransferase [Lachnospiraceae bacterium]